MFSKPKRESSRAPKEKYHGIQWWMNCNRLEMWPGSDYGRREGKQEAMMFNRSGFTFNANG
jgi:hypothetical protein